MYQYVYHGYVLGVVSLQVIQDGIPHVAIVPLPLRTGTAVYVYTEVVLFCLLSSIETFVVVLLLS